MKIIYPLLICFLFLLSCNNSGEPGSPVNTPVKDTVAKKQSFFPVTDYLKGEIYYIKNTGINPLKFTTINGKTDSAWLKIEDLDAAVKEFLDPRIDSVNLTSLFTEKSFLDQSLDAFTFTYDATAQLPDSMKLQRWDVYIDPETSNVKRVYMVKQLGEDKILQLTWVTRQWCKIISMTVDANGSSKIEKEEKLVWDFSNK